MFALVDCNSFYASCEKVFRPDLRNSPIVVLSNNDGCVIARSKEAKKLGYKMGEPYFKVKDRIKKDGVIVFSSNYALYQDLSNRVMATLEGLCPEVEVYSIDEAFLHLKHYPYAREDFAAYGWEIKQTVEKYTGIPVGVGIAPTKTLAKLANHWAKKDKGVCVISKKHQLREILLQTPIKDIWGIGRQHAKSLPKIGIENAYQLAHADKKFLNKHYSVVMERVARELSGERCYDLEPPPEPKKQIVCSRSFGRRVTDKAELSEAIALYTTRATEKLRKQGSHAKLISVRLRTGMFNDKEQKMSRGSSALLVNPTADTRVFLDTAKKLTDALWLDGYRWAKAEVMLGEISQYNPYQKDLFSAYDSKHSDELMSALDAINQKYGSQTAIFASQGTQTGWQMNRDMLSPCYTTRWQDLPVVA